MAKLTKADAARQLGIARSTLYKLIDQGKVSPSPDGLIDQAELVRVAAYVDTLKERTRTSADTTEIPAPRHAETSNGRPQTSSWTSCANSSSSCVTSSRPPGKSVTQPGNVKPFCSTCSSRCSTAMT